MIKLTWHKLTLLSSSISFLLVSYALFIVSMNPATGYELSIYTSTPYIFWVAIIIGLFNGILILFLKMYGKIEKMWIIGIFSIILFNVLVISLYAFRGYILYLGRGDTAGYVGMAKDVNDYGYILNYNFYPLTSILISQISQIINVSIVNISKYLPSLFFGIYILSIYCWSKSLYNNKKFIIASVIVSAPILFPWFSTSIYHMLLSVLTIPFLFYCINKSSESSFKFLAIIWVVLYPFFHPITAMIVFLYISIMYIYGTFVSHKPKPVSIFLVLVALVSLLRWFVSQYSILHNVKLIILQMLNSTHSVSTATQVEYYIQKLGFDAVLKSFLIVNANQVIFYVLAIISIVYIFRIKKINNTRFTPIILNFLICSVFIIIIFFTSTTHNADRLINLNINMILTVPLIGYLLCKSSFKIQAIILFLIMIASVTAIFSVYQSPFITYPNDQMTNNDIVSMKWFLSEKSVKIKTVDILNPTIRYGDIILGYDAASKRNDIHRDIVNLPDHFNLSKDNLFPIDQDRYLSITKYDIVAYTEIWKKIHRFENSDFVNLNSIKNVNRIYDNNENLFYLINKK